MTDKMKKKVIYLNYTFLVFILVSVIFHSTMFFSTVARKRINLKMSLKGDKPFLKNLSLKKNNKKTTDCYAFDHVIWPKKISSNLSYTQNNDCN